MSDDYNYDYDTTKTLHAITRPRLRKAKAAVKIGSKSHVELFDSFFQFKLGVRVAMRHDRGMYPKLIFKHCPPPLKIDD